MKVVTTVCEVKPLRTLAVLCVLLPVVFLLCRDPFLILWWPQIPAQETDDSPLDMATDSIDDMFDGCRATTTYKIHEFGVFEWNFNLMFSYAWAQVERRAKKPAHPNVTEDHAVSVYMFTQVRRIQYEFNNEVNTGKSVYNTPEFQFHYLYFFLTDAIQVLRSNQPSCRVAYLRTQKRFDHDVVNTNMRFGAFVLAFSSQRSLKLRSYVSCFEIYTCFGADITYYSGSRQKGQVLIPTYEVFKITEVLRNDSWCHVVYRLRSTKVPRRDLNCKLIRNFGADLLYWYESNGAMSVCGTLLIISFLVLLKRREKCFVAAVCGALLVLIIVALMLSW